MIQYLLKNTVQVRVATKEEADTLHKQIMEETLNNGWVLSAWTEKHKEVKQKGEIVDEYYIINYTITFQQEKEATDVLTDISYNIKEMDF